MFTEPEDPASELRVPPIRDLPVRALADQHARHGQQQQWGHTPDTLSKEISTHCTENPIYVFPEKELRGLNPDFHIHLSVSDLCMYSQDLSTYFPAAK